MLFNFSTSSNYELLASKVSAIAQDPAQVGFFLAMVYVLASVIQLLIGHLLDKVALKTLYRAVIVVQPLALVLANGTQGWAFYVAQLLFMAAIFGAIPFTDAMVVRFVDDSVRSHVSGMRLAVSLGAVHWRSGRSGPSSRWPASRPCCGSWSPPLALPLRW